MLVLVQRAVALNCSGSAYLEARFADFGPRDSGSDECDALQGTDLLIASRHAVLWFGAVVL
jgi:hypothetical protein